MADTNRFDVLIIGAGQAGIPLARDLAKAGKRVALAERKQLGGSCINFGCTPTKAAVASARLAHLARRGAEFGLRIPTVAIDFRAVIERARAVAGASRSGLDKAFEASENPKLFRAHARIEGREGQGFRVRIGNGTTLADQIVINTGTRSVIPPIPGLTDTKFIHAGNWLEMTELPTHLAVIGAGAIGLEMAQFYRRMGSRVTVIEFSPHIAGHEDTDIADALRTFLQDEQIEFRMKSKVERIDKRPDGVTLVVAGEGASNLKASHIFVATGRRPNTDDIGLETVGVAVSKQGIIAADDRLATNVTGVWVAGDVRGGPQFTHTSWDDYRILLSQLAGDGSRRNKRVVPYAIFTDPELGRVGMTEAQARQAGHAIKIGHFDMSHSGKAAEIGETKGLIKVVIDAGSNVVLGAAVLAADGAELVHSYITLMNVNAPYTVIRDAVYIHPTLAEAVQSAVLDVA
jgi:pyruvate/2-oxoglutarate dehydrogenase complex dihydrolipoamide dehydrogenase (E3) component